MRTILLLAALVGGLSIMTASDSLARDIWLECRTESFRKTPYGGMKPAQRDAEIDRCVRMRGGNVAPPALKAVLQSCFRESLQQVPKGGMNPAARRALVKACARARGQR